jgi:hypothetical protein
MTNGELVKALESEQAMREREFVNAIDAAINLLEEAKANCSFSTHVGHNLGARANELSVIGAKIEAMKSVFLAVR